MAGILPAEVDRPSKICGEFEVKYREGEKRRLENSGSYVGGSGGSDERRR
jgi:hypothetical protein